jgi:hypothetical protein
MDERSAKDPQMPIQDFPLQEILWNVGAHPFDPEDDLDDVLKNGTMDIDVDDGENEDMESQYNKTLPTLVRTVDFDGPVSWRKSPAWLLNKDPVLNVSTIRFVDQTMLGDSTRFGIPIEKFPFPCDLVVLKVINDRFLTRTTQKPCFSFRERDSAMVALRLYPSAFRLPDKRRVYEVDHAHWKLQSLLEARLALVFMNDMDWKIGSWKQTEDGAHPALAYVAHAVAHCIFSPREGVVPAASKRFTFVNIDNTLSTGITVSKMRSLVRAFLDHHLTPHDVDKALDGIVVMMLEEFKTEMGWEKSRLILE